MASHGAISSMPSARVPGFHLAGRREAHMGLLLVLISNCLANVLPTSAVSRGSNSRKNCTWMEPSARLLEYECWDGSLCRDPMLLPGLSERDVPSVLMGDCCKTRGGLARCPPERPDMCGEDVCGKGNFCCAATCWANTADAQEKFDRRKCGELGCIKVDIAASIAPPEGVSFRSSGQWVLLDRSCSGSRCSIHVCDEPSLVFATHSSQAWSFKVGISGIELASTILKKGSTFGLELRSFLGDSSQEQVSWKEIKHGCCAPNPGHSIFSGPSENDDSGLECMEKCLRLGSLSGSQCSYIETSQTSNGPQCNAYAGLCMPTDKPCEGVSKAWHRTGHELAKHVTHSQCYSEEAWREQSWWNFTGAFERCGTSKVCVAGACEERCQRDEQCEGYPQRICRSSSPIKGDSGEDLCKHKALFEITAGADVAAALSVFIVSGLALSAGIGGGGLYVPLLMVIMDFTAHEATGLSQALLAGGASTTLVYNMRQRHPSGLKPMIDYDLALVMGPFLLIGSLIGSSLHYSAPSWLILVLLTAVLCHSAFKTWRKAITTLKKERAGDVKGMPAGGDGRLSKNIIERMLRGFRSLRGGHSRFNEDSPKSPRPSAAQVGGAVSVPEVETVGAPALEEGSANTEGDANEEGNANEEGSGEDEIKEKKPTSPDDVKVRVLNIPSPAKNKNNGNPVGSGQARQDSRPCKPGRPQFPRERLFQFATMWLVTIGCIFARGGRASKGLFEYCGAMYWLITVVAIILLALLGLLAARRAIFEDEVPGDTDEWGWTPQAARTIMLSSFGAGILAALCGIGGGMIMGPIVLDLGVLPQVQSSTTASTLFVLSSSTALAFLVKGTAPVDYAVFLAAMTALGAILGKAIIGFLVKLYRRPSAIVFLLGGIITVSIVVMVITGTIDVVNDARQGQGTGFKSFCDGELSDN